MYLGLRNMVMSSTEPRHWKYLLLYEIDGDNYVHQVKSLLDRMGMSYIIYSTKNGYHFLCVNPVTAQMWGAYFQMLQNRFPEFYSGQTLRFSAKKDEKRELFAFSFVRPYIVKLVKKYADMLHIPDNEIPIFGTPPAYSIVLEKYWSEKD